MIPIHAIEPIEFLRIEVVMINILSTRLEIRILTLKIRSTSVPPITRYLALAYRGPVRVVSRLNTIPQCGLLTVVATA